MDLKRSLGARLGMIAILTLLLLIPSLMIRSLIRERQNRGEQAKAEISSKWGESQIVSGPVISIPYDSYKYAGAKGGGAIRFIHYLPDVLSIRCRIDPQIRKRGIFKAVLYQTQIQIAATFSFSGFENLGISPEDIHWENAVLSVGITDMKGIKDLIKLTWNDSELTANPGVKINDILTTGIHSPIPIRSEPGEYTFSSSMVLNGSSELMFTPLGKVTRVDMSSNWENPSFIGNFLPEKRDISSGEFTAHWKILHLNRNFPQAWIGDKFKIAPSSFGVNLLLPVDEYQKTMRTVKYAILFISLTFLSFFLIEVLNQKLLHPIQYLLIGFAILLFYTLLLSLSEHISFKFAYLFASIGIVGLITAYTRGILKNKQLTGVIGAVLGALYGYLYIVLQLQDYALLMGSLGLFFALALVMYLTQGIDWYSIFQFEKKNKRMGAE